MFPSHIWSGKLNIRHSIKVKKIRHLKQFWYSCLWECQNMLDNYSSHAVVCANAIFCCLLYIFNFEICCIINKTEILQQNFNKKSAMFSPGIEPGTFCVLDRCDNRYTTKTCLRGKEDIGVHILLVSVVMWSPVTAELDWCWPWHLLSAIVHSPMILTHGLNMCVSSTFWGL